MVKKRRRKPVKRRHTVGSNAGNKRFYNRWPFLIGAVLVFTAITLSPVLTAGFAGVDDQELILDRQYAFRLDPGKIFTFSWGTPHYKPVTYFTWMVEYYLAGNAPWIHHLNNLILHLLNCFMVFLIVRRLATQFETTRNLALPLSLAAALLFGIHPMHVESVAWAVERKDVLYTAMFLISVWAYLKYLTAKQQKWLFLSAAGFLLSVFSKAPAMVLPFVLLLLDWVYQRKMQFSLVSEKLPHFIVLGFALFTFGFFSLDTSEGSIGALAEKEIISIAPNVVELPTLYAKALVGSMQAILWYLHGWVPVKLSIAYPREELIGSFGMLIHLLPWILMGALVFLWFKRKQWPLVFFSHAFFLLAMLPAIVRITPGIVIFLNDRYTYLALLGIIILGLTVVLRVKNRTVAFGILGLVVLIFSVQSFRRAQDWNNPDTLWTSAIEKYPSVAYAYSFKGAYLMEEGQLEQALEELNTSVGKYADPKNLNQRGVILRQMGKPAEAVKDYTRAIQQDPDNSQYWINRGNAYIDLRQLDKAIQDFNKAIELKPNSPNAWVNRGVAYVHAGQLQKAVDNFNAAEKFNRHYAETYKNRAIVQFQQGRSDLAIKDFTTYLDYRPDDHEIWYNLGILYQNDENYRKAIACYNKAISLLSKREYLLNRANAYEAIGDQNSAAKDRAAAGG